MAVLVSMEVAYTKLGRIFGALWTKSPSTMWKEVIGREENLSTKQKKTDKIAWFPGADANRRGQESDSTAAPQGPRASIGPAFDQQVE